MKTWNDIETATVAQILAWAEKQAWARAMADCQQDAGWHEEGDVWTHTGMVVAELERLPEWPDLEHAERLKLIFTALFHDAGKPATTVIDPETGRTRSPKHAQVGVEIARRVLRDLGCGLSMREEITALVRYHGRPPYLLEKPDPGREVIGLSWAVNNRLLYLFALADTRGRRTVEMSRPEVDLHLGKLAAEEQGCFERPYPFANDHARFLFFRDALSSLHYVPREAYRCTVTLMCGLPGSGKDWWLAHHHPDLPVVSLDELRSLHDVDPTEDQGGIVQLAREACREHLRAGRDFAFNATNTMRATRKRWIDLFAEYGARVKIIYREPPMAEILRRNAARVNPVPTAVIDRLVDKLEPPIWAEAHDRELVT